MAGAHRLSVSGIAAVAAVLTLAVGVGGGLAHGADGVADAQEAAAPVPDPLVAGGKIVLENDLQAARDSMRLFRDFRRQFRRLDPFEEVDDDEGPELQGVLTSDPEGILGRELVVRGIPFPSGYGSTRMMCLLIYTVEGRNLLWFDCERWETTGTTGGFDSHEKLVRNLRGALEAAGSGG